MIDSSAMYCNNNSQVPLVIFKREKEISRQLEFEGMWIAEQPNDDNLRAQWDRLVLASPTFPQMYWDKFVKKKVHYCSVQYVQYTTTSTKTSTN